MGLSKQDLCSNFGGSRRKCLRRLVISACPSFEIIILKRLRYMYIVYFLACFHPGLPVMLTGSEDGTVRIWHSGTYRLESSLNYGLERVWTISSLKGSNNVAIGLVYG